jgi:hypothetical protein
MTAALDNAFADDLEEIIEHVLLRYRPIFSHTLMNRFRRDLERAIHDTENLMPWHLENQSHPVTGIGPLTAGQVALLGGTRPMRVLHSLAYELEIPLDGGDAQSAHEADGILFHSTRALQSLAEHHVVVPVKGREARVRRLREFVELGVAAQIAALMGGLRESQLVTERPEPEHHALVRRYFLATLQAFGRLELSPRDQDVFSDYYLDEIAIDDLAAERGRGLAAEIKRRQGFLQRLATALLAEIDIMTGGVRRHDAPTPEALAAGAKPKALTRATGAAARPRKR